MEAKIIERFRKKKIKESTRKNHTSTLREVKRFRKSIPFYDLSPQLVEDWRAHLVQHVRAVNTAGAGTGM